MTFRTTIDWSLITSRMARLVRTEFPYPSVDWGIGLPILCVVVVLTRQVF